METQYCPRPPPSPPPTPPPDPLSSDESDLLLNEESDILWLRALDVARSVQDPSGVTIEPYHLILALLYDGIKNIDDIIVRKPPVLDVPLLWKVVHEAGGKPHDLGIDVRKRWLDEVESRSLAWQENLQEPQPEGDPDDLLSRCSSETKDILFAAKASLIPRGDSFVAPHHIILALLENTSVLKLLEENKVDAPTLAALTKRYRPHKVKTRETKPRFFVLEQFASDLTKEAGEGIIGPIIGRDEEIRRLMIILSRRYKCNAVLLGEPGVGKTAVAEGLALRIYNRDEVPEELNCRVFSLDMGSLLASTTCHGKLELRVKAILEEIQANEAEGVPIILYIDSLHLITTGRKTGGAGGMDVANLMKPLLARGSIRCFGSASFHDYKESIEKDGSLLRRFAPIVICEPTAAQTVTVLRGLKRRMEAHHQLSITDTALTEAAYLAARYSTYKRLPDSAIDLVDEACAMLRVNRVLRPEGLDKLLSKEQILKFAIKSLSSELEKDDAESQKLRAKSQASLESLRDEIAAFEDEIDRARIRENGILKLQATLDAESKRLAKLERHSTRVLEAQILRSTMRKTREELNRAKREYQSQHPNQVTPAVIAQVISEQTGIPVQSVRSQEIPQYILLEEDLNKAVIGQADATRAIARAIHLSRSGFTNPGRPVASMLLVGGPGTGKTFIAKQLARLLFDSEDKLLVINGAEYASNLNLTRLIGTPSCSGYDRGGELTECIKRKPFSIVLVDNIDKACPEFHIKFRLLIDQGCLEDGDGKVIDFRNCIILMTTALGSEFITNRRALHHGVRLQIHKELSQRFSPEFVRCLDDVILFLPLSKQNLEQILEIRLEQLQNHLQGKGFTIEIDKELKEHITSESDSELPNAQTLLRKFRDKVEDHLGTFLSESPGPGHIKVTTEGGCTKVVKS